MTSHPSPRVVIDTNIFVPGVVGAIANPPKGSASAGLLRAWRGGLCTVIVSDELLAEYLDVLQRPPFMLQRKRAQRICHAVAGRAVVVPPPSGASLLTADPNDDMVLKAAVTGKADLLVTDNTADFMEIASPHGERLVLRYRGVQIVGLSECLDRIRGEHVGADRVMRQRKRWP